MSLAAAAVGADPHAFYRRRKKDPGFAREVRLALQTGYDRLELALLESMPPSAYEHDEWRHNDPPAIPPMSASQALQQMYLHQKEARLTAEPWWLKRRRGESREAHSERLALMAEERDRLRREEFEIAEAERWAQGLPAWGPAGEDVRNKLGLGPRLRGNDAGAFSLPDLAQVTGWSRADLKKALHDPDVALFGGWRIEQMEEKLERLAWGDE
jgi:hypothetical protein